MASLFKKSKVNKERYGYYFITPFLIVLFIFVIFPIFYSIFVSFTDWDGTLNAPNFIGIDNYRRLIQDKYFLMSISNTWLLWICGFIPQILFGLILAVILTDKKYKGKAFFRWVYFLPRLVTMASVGALFYFILDWRSGSLNQLLLAIGLIKEPINYLQSPTATRTAISFTLFWMWFGYSMIIFMAGIKAIPEELFEAARVDGGSKWKVFRYITLPCLRPVMVYQVVTSVIGGLTMFDVPYVMSGGTGAPLNSVNTMVMHLYNTTFRRYQFGYGATIGVGLFGMVMVCAGITYMLLMRKSIHQD